MRPEKESIVGEIRRHLDGTEYIVLLDCRGLSVAQMCDLRNRLRDAESRMQIVKNRFLGIGFAEKGWRDAGDMLVGPTGMVFGSGDVIRVAKTLRAYIKEFERPALKGGYVGGRRVECGELESMASMPSREVLLGMLVGTVAAPMTRLVGAMHQKLSSLVYVLKAAEDKKRGQES